jgi:putative membrane protein
MEEMVVKQSVTVGAVLAGCVVAPLPLVAWAQERPWDGWGMHPMWGVWGLWGIGMMLAMFLFWGLVIAGIVLGIRWLAGERRPRQSDRAREILRERYARGEINREEFDARRKDLEAS